jgi:hypothetical protein
MVKSNVSRETWIKLEPMVSMLSRDNTEEVLSEITERHTMDPPVQIHGNTCYHGKSAMLKLPIVESVFPSGNTEKVLSVVTRVTMVKYTFV